MGFTANGKCSWPTSSTSCPSASSASASSPPSFTGGHAPLQMFSLLPSAVNSSVPDFCPQDGGNEPSDAAFPVFYSGRPGATYYR